MNDETITLEMAHILDNATEQEIESVRAFVDISKQVGEFIGGDKYHQRGISRVAYKISGGNYYQATQILKMLLMVTEKETSIGFDFFVLLGIYYERFDTQVKDATKLKLLNKY